MKRNQARTEQMQSIIEQWEQSGQSQRAFAQANNINYYTFRYWIEKLYKKELHSGFIELPNVSSGNSAICLRYPNGVELLLPGQTPLSTLKGLIKL